MMLLPITRLRSGLERNGIGRPPYAGRVEAISLLRNIWRVAMHARLAMQLLIRAAGTTIISISPKALNSNPRGS
jgi:hypothetical protein